MELTDYSFSASRHQETDTKIVELRLKKEADVGRKVRRTER